MLIEDVIYADVNGELLGFIAYETVYGNRVLKTVSDRICRIFSKYLESNSEPILYTFYGNRLMQLVNTKYAISGNVLEIKYSYSETCGNEYIKRRIKIYNFLK
jgi:hypothetical protein